MADGPHIPDALPIRSLLVPLDGSALAEAALVPASAIARATGATVTLLHVVERDAPVSVHGEPHLGTEAAATAYLEGVARRWAEMGVQARARIDLDIHREASAGIVEEAAALGADLLVLAAHGSGGLRGFLFGRVAQQVLRRGELPILMTRPGAGEQTGPDSWETIALLLSGQGEAEAAMPCALALAEAFDARLHLVRAVPTLGTLDPERAASAALLPGTARAVMEIEEEEARAYLSRIAEGFRARGQRVTAAVVRGDPASAVIAEAIRAEADVLALASHGRHGLAGIWSGSVGGKIFGRFTGPLLLVPAPRRGSG